MDYKKTILNLILLTLLTSALAMVSAPALYAATTQPPTITQLPPNQPADYQIGGPYSPRYTGATVITRDWREQPAGKYPICYVNSFQTQPEQKEWWTKHYPNLILKHDNKPVEDKNWKGEFLLDISTQNKRQTLSKIVGKWFTSCANKGYKAVEPDNLDTWTRSKRLLDKKDAIEFSKLLVTLAHDRGLAIAQKNTTQLLSKAKTIGWDFVVVEECQYYKECNQYQKVFGNKMIEIEYEDAGGYANYQKACAMRGDSITIVYRDRNLLPHGKQGYRYATC